MKSEWVRIAICVLIGLCGLSCIFIAQDRLVPDTLSKTLMAVGGAVVVLSSLLIRGRFSTRPQSRIMAKLGKAADPLLEWETQLEKQQAAFDEAVRQLDLREQRLTEKLVTYHSWAEFPEPVDVSIEGEQVTAGELAEKDAETLDLLNEETQRIFDAILANRYSTDGQVQLELLRDEAMGLANRVARIYQPDSKAPLLETSSEQILVAAGRICIQMMVAVDELPLNVKQMNIQSLYSYVKTAVNAYGVYRKAQPYMNYASAAFYASRFASGVNPVASGAMWLLQSIGKKAASSITSKYFNRHAMALLSNVIHAIGFEAAQIYGGDFRHRDPNWFYGMELVELHYAYPLQGESLNEALNVIGALQLRSEYDRIFLFRQLAASASCDPGKYKAVEVLSEEQRERIMSDLTEFATLHVTAEGFSQWQADVVERL
ncbi:MAG: hypothetical protein ACJZ8O_11300 [Pirellulaceae bacterium]